MKLTKAFWRRFYNERIYAFDLVARGSDDKNVKLIYRVVYNQQVGLYKSGSQYLEIPENPTDIEIQIFVTLSKLSPFESFLLARKIAQQDIKFKFKPVLTFKPLR